MKQEIKDIKAVVKPTETLVLVDGIKGQDDVHTSNELIVHLDFDRVVMTNLDGDTRGGGTMSIRCVLYTALKYISSV